MDACRAESTWSLAEAGSAAEPVVDVRDVTKDWIERAAFGFGRTRRSPVLAGVSFKIGRGEVVAVLGENGAGKSTLLKIVAGLARPDAGSVRVFGADWRRSTPELQRRVRYSGGERGFYFRLTARENLAFFGALDGIGPNALHRRITDVAEILDLGRVLDRRFATFSSGLRQRLLVARALLTQPELLVLDEPTHALDPGHAAQVRRLVRETLVAQANVTVIVATNLIDEAVELGDRVGVLRAQRLTFVERPQERGDDGPIRALFGLPHHG